MFVGDYCNDLMVGGACEQLMTSTPDGSCVCACSDGFALNADGRTCSSGESSRLQAVIQTNMEWTRCTRRMQGARIANDVAPWLGWFVTRVNCEQTIE